MNIKFQSILVGKKSTQAGQEKDFASVTGTDLATNQIIQKGFYLNTYNRSLLSKFQALRPGQDVTLTFDPKFVSFIKDVQPISAAAEAGVGATSSAAGLVAGPAPARAQAYTPKAKDPEESNRISRSVALNNGALFGIEILKASKDPKKAVDFAVTSALLAAAKFADFLITGKTPLLTAGTIEKPVLAIPEGAMPEVPEIPEDDIPF